MKKMLVFQRKMWQEYFAAAVVVAAAAVAASEQAVVSELVLLQHLVGVNDLTR